MSAQEEIPSLTDDRWVWIRVRNKTREYLQRRGHKGDSYDDVIWQLIYHAEAL